MALSETFDRLAHAEQMPRPAVVLVSLVGSVATAHGGTRFLGPNGIEVRDANVIPVEWRDWGIRWRAKLPDEGISLPIVWRQDVFVTEANLTAGSDSSFAPLPECPRRLGSLAAIKIVPVVQKTQSPLVRDERVGASYRAGRSGVAN